MNALQIVGIGVDIESVDRFATIDVAMREKIFTDAEVSYCLSKKNPAPHFAVRFAAKEAVIKALHSLALSLQYQNIEVEKEADGAPRVRLHDLGHLPVSLETTLSHTDSVAVAVVIAVQ